MLKLAYLKGGWGAKNWQKVRRVGGAKTRG